MTVAPRSCSYYSLTQTVASLTSRLHYRREAQTIVSGLGPRPLYPNSLYTFKGVFKWQCLNVGVAALKVYYWLELNQQGRCQ
jgi:hypothetical protein